MGWNDVTNKFDTDKTETGFLVFIFGVSVFMLYYSFDYEQSGTFLRGISIIVILFSVPLLLRGILPNRVEKYLEESADIVEHEDVFESEEHDVSEGAPGFRTFYFMGLITVYGIASLTIGLKWASILFVLLYAIQFRLKWYSILGLVVLTYAITRVFEEVLLINLDTGLI